MVNDANRFDKELQHTFILVKGATHVCHQFVTLLWKAEKDIRRKGKRMAESKLDCDLKKLGQRFQVLL